MKKRTGLFFGSFNPIHIGHLIIAEHMLYTYNLEEVWLVVSPQNPFKTTFELWPEQQRLEMVKLAIADNARLKACDVEFGLAKPSYTVQTMRHLSIEHTDRDFFIIMGSDNLASFKQWKDYAFLLEHYRFLVYYRAGFEQMELMDHPNVRISEAPVLHISATFIRERLQTGTSIRYLVLPDVERYIFQHGLARPL